MLRNFLLLILTILTIQAKAQSLGKQLDNATRIAGELRESGEIEPAIQQLDSLLLIAKEAGQRYHVTNITYQLGLVYLDRGDETKGLKFCEEAFEGFKALDGRFNSRAGSSLMNVGDFLREQGRITEAQNYITRGIEYMSEHIVTINDSIMLVNLYNRRSDLWRVAGDGTRAKEVIYEAPFWPGVGYTRYYTNLANAFQVEGVYLDSAEIYFRKDLAFNISQEGGTALSQSNLAEFLMEQLKLSEVEELLINSLESRRIANDSDTLVSFIALARYNKLIGDLSNMEIYLQQADASINKLTDEENIVEYYKEARDFAALSVGGEDYLKFSEQYDSLRTKKYEDDRLRIMQAENELNISKVEQENAEQEKRILQQTIINILLGSGAVILFGLFYYFLVTSRKMKALSARNELLVREQNHRVKNNLQMINSLLSLQAGRLKDEQSKDVLKRSQTRIQAISLLNRSLYEQKDISEVQLNQYLNELANDVINSITDQEVVFHLEVSDIEINIDKATSLGLIINELIVNSIKHGDSNNVGFDLKVAIENDQVTLNYSDRSKNFNLETYKKSRSFGKRLIELQAKQLKGELEILDSDHFELNLVFHS